MRAAPFILKRQPMEHDLSSTDPENEKKRNRTGLYLTLIFHLVLIIILSVTGITTMTRSETSFVLDLSAMEEREMLLKQEKIKDEASAEIEKALKGSSDIRNAIVRSDSRELKDDRNTNVSELYEDARKLQEKLDASREAAEQERENAEDVAVSKRKRTGETYRGPSVLSYRMDGRKPVNLPIPSYKCEGGGDVTVAVVINRSGFVVHAEIMEGTSSQDECIREYALKAARISRFSASEKADRKQAGEITYRFIAQ